MTPEKRREKKEREFLRKLGGFALKFVSPGNAGVPDRLIFLPGGRIFIREHKGDGLKASKLQKIWIKRFERLGFDVRVTNSDKTQARDFKKYKK